MADLWTWRDEPLAPGRAVVVDIDGVIADNRHRLHYLDRRPKDWDRFFAAADADVPIAAGLRLLDALDPEVAIVLLTGRPVRLRGLTVDWLERHGVAWDLLGMRPDDDRSQATNFKRRAVDALNGLGWDIELAIDDEPAVADAYERAGIPCFRVAFGR
ncbi:MAG: hypothetical protein QOJ19_2181 [Acidimicrobiia bacterium]|jgi:hypothetical protein|nr:hypothetical protein [Acidimicrobiia bacterium]